MAERQFNIPKSVDRVVRVGLVAGGVALPFLAACGPQTSTPEAIKTAQAIARATGQAEGRAEAKPAGDGGGVAETATPLPSPLATRAEAAPTAAATAAPVPPTEAPRATDTPRPTIRPSITPNIRGAEGNILRVDHQIDDIPLQRGEALNVTPEMLRSGAVVAQGDLMIVDKEGNPFRAYDNVEDTGSITIIEGPGLVVSQYGGDVDLYVNKAILKPTVLGDAEKMRKDGCVKGCREVVIYHWDGTKLDQYSSGLTELSGTTYATPTVINSANATPVTEGNHIDFPLKPGDSMVAEPGCVGQGDLTYDNKPMYDSKEDTGLITRITKRTTVFAKYGGDVACQFPDTEAQMAYIKDVQLKNFQNGCKDGCAVVDVLEVPGDPQGVQKSIIPNRLAR